MRAHGRSGGRVFDSKILCVSRAPCADTWYSFVFLAFLQVSRSSADYIDTANTLRIATRFARIVNACTKRVLSIDPRQLSFAPLDAILSFQERADLLSVLSPHRSPLGEGFGDSSAEAGAFDGPILQGSALRVPKSPIQSFRQLSPAITDSKPQAKSKSTAEVIHLTLSQVENIEQVANEIMETTRQVDRAIRDSPAPTPTGRERGERGGGAKTVSEEESSGGEGSFYSSVLPARELSTYQDPILSGAVRFMHSSSSSSSSAGSGEVGGGVGSGAQDEAEGRGYEHSRGGSYAALNEAARQAALSRLEELKGERSVQSSSALALPLHSPVTSEETDHSDKGLAERERATPSPSSSISVASSAKSVETQRKLDNLKQSFRSMSRELELPSAAIEIPQDEAGGAEASSGSENGDEEKEVGLQAPAGRGRRGSEATEETVVTAGDLANNARLDALAKSTAAAAEEREAEEKRREAEAAVGRQKTGSGLYEGRYEFDQDLGPESGPDAFIQERDGVGGSSPRPSQRDYADLERAYDSLLKMLEREREAYVSSQQKLKLVERDLLESQHTLSAQLDGQKLENVHLRSRCRQLEELIGYAPAGEGLELSRALPGLDPGSEASGERSGGGLLGEIFEQLETEVDRLNEENALLREDLQSAHLSHAETVAIVHRKIEGLSRAAADDDEGGEGGRDGDDGDGGDGEDGSHGAGTVLDQDAKDVLRAYRREQRELLSRHQRNKLQALTKRTKKVEEELREARSEVASYRKKDRKYAIHKRGVEETIRKCGLLQRELDHKDQDLVRSQLKFAEAEGKCYTLSQDRAKMAASVQKMREKLEHSETVKRKYAEQLGWARKQVTREAVLFKLPQLPSGSSEIDSHRVNSLATRKVQSTASEICRRIRREPGLSPRIENMLDRLMQETALHVQERTVLARREALLLQMITGDQFQGLVGGGRRR